MPLAFRDLRRAAGFPEGGMEAAKLQNPSGHERQEPRRASPAAPVVSPPRRGGIEDVMTSAPFLSRSFGDYLLVAQLSEDALGTVYRALYAADERRFVRLRILQSAELSRDALVRAFEANAARVESLAHDTIVPRSQLAVAEELPFVTWDETAGWTLDTMLARVRAFGIRIPAEYALLIAERIASALEHAHRCRVDGLPTHHGMLWPGFVSISHDAAVRVGGFGVAEGVLPTLAAPRLTSEIAPYIAPESRAFADVGTNSDV